ncbi:MAG: endonuclease/exonuclease/phosphatase family protein [Panacagrimonas sp.]
MSIAPASSGSGRSPLRILSFNIQLGLNTARYADYLTQGWRHVLPARSVPVGLTLAAHAIRGYDFVAIQEADAGSLRSARVDQIAYLAKHAGYPHHGHTITRNLAPIARHSLGFVSRWPAQVLSDQPLPGRIPGRRVLQVRIEPPQGPLSIFVVHLSLDRSTQARQIEYIASLTDRDVPSILMGDFNCDAGVLRDHPALKRAGFVIRHPDRPTFPSWAPTRAIDHIVTSPHLMVDDLRTLPQLHSDHLPLEAQVSARDLA